MKIAFHNRQRRTPVDVPALGRDFERLLALTGDELKADPPSWLKKRQLQQIFGRGELSLVLVSNRAIKTINKQWRDQDKATDVLSFPLELDPPLWLQTLTQSKKTVKSKKQKTLEFDQDSAAGDDDSELHHQWLVGEVIISLERAEEQAREYGHSLERELGFLFVHGVLHVLGFDHMNKEDEKEMFGRQRRILDAAGIKRR